jgi:hypothetical protein
MADGDSRPVPDPTVLTTEQLHREISALSELTSYRVAGQKELVEEQFRTVHVAMEDAKEAVGFALTAAKESQAKSEASFTKQIDQMGLLIGAATQGNSDKIDDIKDRLTLIDGRITGIEGRTKGATDNSGSLLSLAAVVISAIAVIVAIFFSSRGH